jgi:hypothetical protein
VQVLQALIAGNAVLLKPGTGGDAAALLLRDMLLEAGLSADLLTVLAEEAAAAESAISAGVDKIFLTGAAETGVLCCTRRPNTLRQWLPNFRVVMHSSFAPTRIWNSQPALALRPTAERQRHLHRSAARLRRASFWPERLEAQLAAACSCRAAHCCDSRSCRAAFPHSSPKRCSRSDEYRVRGSSGWNGPLARRSRPLAGNSSRSEP